MIFGDNQSIPDMPCMKRFADTKTRRPTGQNQELRTLLVLFMICRKSDRREDDYYNDNNNDTNNNDNNNDDCYYAYYYIILIMICITISIIVSILYHDP